MTPEEEAAAAAAEATRRFTKELLDASAATEKLRLGFEQYRPKLSTKEREEKAIHGVISKIRADGNRALEEAAVRAARARGATEDEALKERLKVRKANEEGLAKATYTSMQALSGLGKTAGLIGGFSKAMGEGAQGFKELNPIIDAAAAAFSTIPFFGGAVKAAAEGAKFMLGQLQNATDAFQDLSKVGGLTADGMSGLQRQFLTSGMQLKSYTNTIKENSAALANFGGSVGTGAERFADTAGMVQKDFGISLQRLGFGIDEIGETTASYIARQTRLGLAQGKSIEQLAVGANKYALELDELSRLTGASKEGLKKEQDAQMSELIYRSHIEKVKASGDANAIAEMEKHSLNIAAISKQYPGMAQALKDNVTGFVGTSKASIEGAITFGNDLGTLNQAAKGDSGGFLNTLKQLSTKALPLAADLGSLGVQVGIHTKELGDAAAMEIRNGQLIRKEQENTIKGPGDALTNSTVDAQRNMQQLAIQMQTLGFTFMPEASKAVSNFTGALNKLLGMLTDKLGVKKVTVSGGAVIPSDTPAAGAAPVIPTAGAAPQTAAEKQAAKQAAYNARFPGETNEQRRQREYDEKQAAKLVTGTTATAGTPAAAGSMDSGPVFGNKVQVTLIEIRDEIKKLVRMGAIPSGTGAAVSGQAQVQSALTEHDHAHPHPPSADVSPELAAKIGTLVAPLEKMNQTSGFIRNDGKTMHGAVDLAGKIGDKVMAPISGMAKVLSDPKGYGNYVEVTDTITGVKHILAHLDKTMIKTGDMVKAGQQVGTVGNTGMSTGPHLHHEIKLPDGTRVDPNKFYAGAARQPGTPGAPSVAGVPGGAAGRDTPGAPSVAGVPGGAAGRAPSSADMTTYMRTVAMLESGGDPKAKNTRSSAGGLFQFLESSYEGVTGRKGSGAERFDPAKSTEAMAKFSQDQKSQMEKNLGRGVSGADLYMGHFLGAGGATKFLGAKDRDPTQSAAKFDPAAAKANPEIYFNKGKERSMDEVYQLMTEKYRKSEASVMSGNIPALVASITGTGTLSPGGMAGPSGVPTPVAAAPGTTAALPAAPAATTSEQPQQPSTVAQQNSLMLQQLVTLNQTQNGLLSRILQTSQA